MPVTDDLINADAARAATITADLMRRCYEAADERDEDDVRLEVMMVVGVLCWTDAEGVEREDVVTAAESKRKYVQEGVLRGALRRYDEANPSEPWGDEG